ncbi:SAM-dependent methyltransferase [Candidatus Omnitrophota bacterium]
MPNSKMVDPALYTREYFLEDSEGHKEYKEGLADHIHPKFKLAYKIACLKCGDNVLDIGCGRGELVYYCALNGIRATGIDYSDAAFELSGEARELLPEHARRLAKIEIGDVLQHEFREAFDCIFMVEVAEHMYDDQLKRLFKKVGGLLSKNGKLIVITPNIYYERYLSPLKRILNMPINMIKWPLRFLRGKYAPGDAPKVIRNFFRITVDRGELNRMLYVNALTPGKLRRLLSDFDARVTCNDHSSNLLSLALEGWWGRDLIAVARNR